MVTSEIQTAVLVGGFTVMGSAVTAFATYMATVRQQKAAKNRTEIRQHQENKRHLAEFYIDRKVDLFLEAYDAMFDLQTRIISSIGDNEDDLRKIDIDEFSESYDILLRSLRRCWIFLSIDEVSILRDYENEVDDFYEFLLDDPDTIELSDAEDLWKSYYYAEKVITDEISEPVSLFESEIFDGMGEGDHDIDAEEIARSDEKIREIFSDEAVPDRGID